MVLWINGAFGAGKTTIAHELYRRLPNSYIYDPENLGYFLRKNMPPPCGYPDFQDIPLWREGNYCMLAQICRQYSGIVIVPMTLVCSAYEQEILGRLEADGLPVKRFILYASRKTLLRRLKKRSFGRLSREQFALDSIDRCLNFFDCQSSWTSISTDGRSVEQIVNDLAGQAGLPLLPGQRNHVKKILEKISVLLKHIR